MEVSIIIPYNKDRGFLIEAIRSATLQTGMKYGVDYEIVIQQGDASLGVNFNNAVKRSKGKYLKTLADDDLLTPNSIHDLWTKARQGFDVVCGGAINFTDKEETVQFSRVPRSLHELALNNTIHGGTVIYSREAFMAVGGFDEGMWTAEEYDLHLRMAKAGAKFTEIDRIVYRYRMHVGQKSSTYWAKDPKTGEYRFEYIERLQNRFLNDHTKIVTS